MVGENLRVSPDCMVVEPIVPNRSPLVSLVATRKRYPGNRQIIREFAEFRAFECTLTARSPLTDRTNLELSTKIP